MLFSASADRTIIVRTIAFGRGQKAAFIPIRVITLKSSPVAFTMLNEDLGTLLVSTTDRQLHKYNIKTGGLLRSNRAIESTKNESVLLSSIKVGALGSGEHQVLIVFGVSSTDKSIRAYDCETGGLLAREYGQFGTSDCAFFQRTQDNEAVSHSVVSTGLDGTIMIWDCSLNFASPTTIDDSTFRKSVPGELVKHTRPLRKILSRSELSEYQKSFESSQNLATPTRNHHSSRVRKKVSQLNLGAGPKNSGMSSTSRSTYRSPSSSVPETADTKTLRNPSRVVSHTKASLASRIKRSSLDASLLHGSSNGDSNLQMSRTEQLCQTLRNYREKISSELPPDLAEQLEKELTLTLHAIRPRMKGSYNDSEDGIHQDGSDGWLAKMIDERLALKLGHARKGDEELHSSQSLDTS